MKSFKELISSLREEEHFTPESIHPDTYISRTILHKFGETNEKDFRHHHKVDFFHEGERRHLDDYIDGSHDLNNALWEHHKKGTPISRSHSLQIHSLDKLTLRHSISPNHGPVSLYSGVQFNPGMKAAKGGGKIFLPAFTSTSLDPSVAHGFAGVLRHGAEDHLQDMGADYDDSQPTNSHVIRFHWHPGNHGLYVAPHSWAQGEKEVILPRNLSVHIDPKPVMRFDRDHPIFKKHTFIWNAHINPDSPHIHNDGIKE